MLKQNKFMSKILQLNIELKGFKPKIKRRFLVEDSISFQGLHRIIQVVMGWEDYHLYSFNVGKAIIEAAPDNRMYVDSMWNNFSPEQETRQANTVRLSDYLNKEKMKFLYNYDFGDMWSHIINVEKIIENDGNTLTPFCLDGENSCPPEDCGGIYGYNDLLDILKNKKHPEYEEKIVDWLGEDFDPNLFDIKKVNSSLSRIKPIYVADKRIGRNELCPCGSGKKYKKCCINI